LRFSTQPNAHAARAENSPNDPTNQETMLEPPIRAMS
jgi:hypothetical protein